MMIYDIHSLTTAYHTPLHSIRREPEQQPQAPGEVFVPSSAADPAISDMVPSAIPEPMNSQDSVLLWSTGTVVTASFIASSVIGPAGIAAADSPAFKSDSGDLAGYVRNFRICSNDWLRPAMDFLPSREGLDTLKMSGSSQFGTINLPEILEKIPSRNVIIVDLREESHIIADDLPYSWRNKQNNMNKGFDMQSIKCDETSWLDRAKSEGPHARYTCTEKELCQQEGIGYERIPVTDHSRPDDQDVDQFIALVQSMPKDSWLHFHCKAGLGRTTTFMAMYDMMHNARNVGLHDITGRQYLLGGIDLMNSKPGIDSYRIKADEDRRQFVREFYHYCQDNSDNFATTWSQWKNAQNKSTQE